MCGEKENCEQTCGCSPEKVKECHGEEVEEEE